jgi:hypothetical protein
MSTMDWRPPSHRDLSKLCGTLEENIRADGMIRQATDQLLQKYRSEGTNREDVEHGIALVQEVRTRLAESLGTLTEVMAQSRAETGCTGCPGCNQVYRLIDQAQTCLLVDVPALSPPWEPANDPRACFARWLVQTGRLSDA